MVDAPAPAAPAEGVNLEAPAQYDPYASFPSSGGAAKDPAQMERGEYWKGVAANLPSSAYENVAGTLHAIAPWNWGETAEGIGALGTGISSKVEGALGYQQDPEKKSADEAILNEVIKPFTSKEEFYRGLYNDPFSVLAVAATPVTLGESGLESAASALGKTSATAGKVASAAGKTAGIAGNLMDPTQVALGIAGKAGDVATGTAKHAVALGTGVPTAAYERAFQAGASKDPLVQGAFNTFARGEGETSDFSNAMSNAFAKIKNREISDWASKKKENFAALQQDASLQPMYDAIDAARNKLSAPGSNKISDDAHQALDYWENQLFNRSTLPAGHPDRGIESLDKLKQDIGVAAGQAGSDRVSNALWELYHGTKKAITDVSPEYSQMMDDYRNIQNNLKNISGGLGVNKATANAQLSKAIRNLRTPMGNDLLDSLGKEDPRIPYMAAGAALHDAISSGTVGRMLEGGGGAFHLYNAGTSLAMGDPTSAAKHIGLLGAQAIFQSPRLMGATAYGAGRLAGSPIGQAAGVGTKAAGYSARALSPLEQNLNRAYEELYGQPTGQAAYATGGRTGTSAKTKAETLINMVDKIKKEQGNETKPLLNLDDTTVAKALAIANRGI